MLQRKVNGSHVYNSLRKMDSIKELKQQKLKQRIADLTAQVATLTAERDTAIQNGLTINEFWATSLAENDRLADAHDKLVERSVLAMSYAEDEPELWESVEPDCPMLEAVRQLRRRADSEYSLRVEAESSVSRLTAQVHEWEESDAAALVLGPLLTEENDRLTVQVERLEQALQLAAVALRNWGAENDRLAAQVERLTKFIRQIFGPKYDKEIAAMSEQHSGEQPTEGAQPVLPKDKV